MTRSNTALARLAALPCAVALLISSPLAQAETSPYYIGASQSVTRESNVFKVSDQNDPRSDFIWGTSLFGGVDQMLGRQRVYARASVQNNSYNRLSRLDFVGYDVSAGLDWATIERLTGGLSYSRHRGEGDYGRPEQANAASGKFTETTEQMAASVRYGLTGDLGVTGGVEHRRSYSSSRSLTSSDDLTSDVARIGLSYGLGGSVVLGTGFRYTWDDREQVDGNKRSSNRRDLDFTAVWTPSALTSLNARLSVGDGSAFNSSQGSSSRVTGAVGATYSPTGRLRFTGSFSRDTGSETTFINSGNAASSSGPAGSFVDTNRVTNTSNLGVVYELTARISLNGGYSRSDGSYRNQNGSSSDNTVNRYSLGARYAVARNVSLGCDLRRESRAGSSASINSYSSNNASCTVSYTLQ